MLDKGNARVANLLEIKSKQNVSSGTQPDRTPLGEVQNKKRKLPAWFDAKQVKKTNQKTNKQKQAHRSKWNMILTLFWSFYWPLNDNFFSFISPCLDERFCSTFQLEKNVASNFTLVIYFYPRSSSLHYWNAVRLQCNPKVGIKCMAHSCADTWTISKYTIAIFFIKISFSFFWKKTASHIVCRIHMLLTLKMKYNFYEEIFSTCYEFQNFVLFYEVHDCVTSPSIFSELIKTFPPQSKL